MPRSYRSQKKIWANVVRRVTERSHCARHDTSRWIEIRVGWMSAALILGAVFLACPELASAQETCCPKSISADQTIEKVPEAWTAEQDEFVSSLVGIAFYSGPPEEKAMLAYDRWTKRNGLEYGIWHFQPKSSHRIWLSCRYSYARVVLVRQLPAEASECIVTYDPKVSVSGCSPGVRKIACH
jgi:hypothetical protein